MRYNKPLIKIILYLVILIQFETCFDIFQTIEITKDKVLKSSIRIKIFLKNDNKSVDIPIKPLELKEYPNLKSKINNISNEYYNGFDSHISIPIKDLTTPVIIKNKDFPILPSIDKYGQLLFPFVKKDQIEKVENESEKLARGILGMYSYKMYFPGEWRPKSALLINIFTLNKANLEVTDFGSGSLLDIPLSYIVDNYILILSPLKKVNTSEIKNLAKKLTKKINKNESQAVESPPQKLDDKKADDSEEDDDD